MAVAAAARLLAIAVRPERQGLLSVPPPSKSVPQDGTPVISPLSQFEAISLVTLEGGLCAGRGVVSYLP